MFIGHYALALAAKRCAPKASLGGLLMGAQVPDLVWPVGLLLWPGGSARFGLGLWYSVPGTLLVEGSLFSAGCVVYGRATRAKDRIRNVALAVFVLLLAGAYVADRLAPPPPDARFLAWAALCSGWLSVLGAAWMDRHRAPRD